MFDKKERTLQSICALMFWSHRVASAATDIAVGASLNADPNEELTASLERLHEQTGAWLAEVCPLSPSLVLDHLKESGISAQRQTLNGAEWTKANKGVVAEICGQCPMVTPYSKLRCQFPAHHEGPCDFGGSNG